MKSMPTLLTHFRKLFEIATFVCATMFFKQKLFFLLFIDNSGTTARLFHYQLSMITVGSLAYLNLTTKFE